MEKITTKEVLEWAKDFLVRAEKELTPEEVKEQKKFASLIQTPSNKTVLSKMLDESSQIRDKKLVVKRMKELINEYGVPDFVLLVVVLLYRATHREQSYRVSVLM